MRRRVRRSTQPLDAMGLSPNKADSLDRIEVLMALEDKFPELGTAFETLWDLDPNFDEKAVVPLRPHIVAPVDVKAVRGGMETHVTVIARCGDLALGLDHDCRQVAVGTLRAGPVLQDVRHYRTLEMGARAFLSESGHAMASNTSLQRTREI